MWGHWSWELPGWGQAVTAWESFIYIYFFSLSAQNNPSRRDSRTCSPTFQCRGKHGDRTRVPRGQRHGDGLELWGMMDGSGLLLSSFLMRCTNGNFPPWNAFSLRQESSAIYRQQEQEMRSSVLCQSLCREWEPRWVCPSSALGLQDHWGWSCCEHKLPSTGASCASPTEHLAVC